MRLLERFISIEHGVKSLTDDSYAEYIMFIGPFHNTTRIFFDYAERVEHSDINRELLQLHRKRSDDSNTLIAEVEPDKVDEDMLSEIIRE